MIKKKAEETMTIKKNYTKADEHFVRAMSFMMRWYDKMNCKTLAAMVGMKTARTINSIISRQTGAGKEVAENISAALGLSYGKMLHLGELLVDGVDEEAALLYIRNGDRAHLNSTGFTIQQGDNNVAVTGVLAASGAGGDISRDLCAAIARRMEGLGIDAQIALRARVKAALEDQEFEGEK